MYKHVCFFLAVNLSLWDVYFSYSLILQNALTIADPVTYWLSLIVYAVGSSVHVAAMNMSSLRLSMCTTVADKYNQSHIRVLITPPVLFP